MKEYLTKFCWAFPTANCKAETVSRILFEHIFCQFGFPNSLLSDQGSSFMSQIVTELCRYFDVIKQRSSPYMPSTNGSVECLNKSIIKLKFK